VGVITVGESTAIAWTDHTFNPWWGCERVSPGCQHCYAETFAKRTGHDVWGKTAERRFFGDKHWAEPLKWNAAAEAAGAPALVFCSSMADVFEDRPELVAHRERLFDLIEATPHLIWQLLTKRPQNIHPMTQFRWFHGFPFNVWVGTTVEDQQRAYERIPILAKVPATVRFLSMEPLLGSVDLDEWLPDPGHGIPTSFEWVIVGGESGPGHRPLNVDHARDVVAQCTWAVPVFFKQHGGRTPTAGGDVLDGERIKEFPAYLKRSSRTRVVEVSSEH
jgi:protein gp37